MYADKITESMRKTIEETNRSRIVQTKYNLDNNITPLTIYKSVEEIMSSTSIADVRRKEEQQDFSLLKLLNPVLKIYE